MPQLPLSYNLRLLHEWGERADIPFWSQPSTKNSVRYAGRPACCRNDTCSPICPIGAKYSPDFTWRALSVKGKVELVTRTLVRRLVLSDNSDRIDHAIAIDRDNPDKQLEFHATTFIVAGGYVWSPHLLLLSQNTRFPDGLANSSGLVGKYLNGHRNVSAFVSLPMKLYPGIHSTHSLVTKKFMRNGPMERYVRHDLRIWESTVGREPRLRDDNGSLLLGDEIMRDWRSRAENGAARVRAYYDVLPDRESAVTLDTSRRNAWGGGDPLPRLSFRDSPVSRDLRAHTEDSIRNVFTHMARVGNGKILSTQSSDFQDHPAGGCRMGDNPATSVCDDFGRTHDHENLFVVGAPTCVTGGCANGTLTFVALGLRSASRIAEEY